MYKKIKKKIKRKIFKKFFSEYNRVHKSNYSDFNEDERGILENVKAYTMTSPERIVSLVRAIDYIEENKIEGSIVECGVWKGGSIMAVLLALREKTRDIYLYDTFEGMTEPTNDDYSFKGNSAIETYKDKQGNWCYSSLEEVKNNISKVNYPEGIPRKIALLRLDTDWYESTKHEMEYLFPRLVKGGIIVIDDYGHWQGCKKAIDEYIIENDIKIFLSRVDYSCRIGVKE
jgi:O-methyltransferase